MKNIEQFKTFKKEKKKISMLTCYDYSFAKIMAETEVDCLLVGDSLAMVMHGFDSTIHATPELMALHTAAVKRGAPNKFIIGDMPFLSVRKGKSFALDVADKLMKAGANCIKIEGIKGHEDVISHCVDSGIPVMGHLGLTPQSVHQLSGYKVQGRKENDALKILAEAKSLEALGCFSVVLECVPTELAKEISQSLEIPTIGIGAGLHTDGQVLVLQDMLGMNLDFQTKFVRKFANVGNESIEGFNQFHKDINADAFPSKEESFQ